MTSRLDRRSFRRWLRSLPPEAEFRTKNCARCPLAAYLAAHGAPAPYVDEIAYRQERDGPERRLPLWARFFVEEVTTRAGFRDRAVGVTEALEALEAVP